MKKIGLKSLLCNLKKSILKNRAQYSTSLEENSEVKNRYKCA